MKKLLFFLMLFVMCSAQAQVLLGKEPPIVGGSEGKNYAVIIESPLSKKAMLDSVLNLFSEMGIVAKDKVDVIDDKVTEVKVDLTRSIGFFVEKKMMGVALVLPPSQVDFTLRAEFYETGKIRLVAEDFDLKFLTMPGSNTAISKDQSPTQKAYWDAYNTVYMSNSALGKVITFVLSEANGFNLTKVRESMAKVVADEINHYMLAEAMVKAGEASWQTMDTYVNYLETTPKYPGKNYEVAAAKKYLEEGRLGQLSQNKWKKDVRARFNQLYSLLAASVKGKILKAAEDGVVTWDLVNDKLVPVDEKLQKKFIKKGWTFEDNSDEI